MPIRIIEPDYINGGIRTWIEPDERGRDPKEDEEGPNDGTEANEPKNHKEDQEEVE